MEEDKVVPINSHQEYVTGAGTTKSLDFSELTRDDLGTGLWDQEIRAFMEARTLKGLFFHEDWPFIVVDLVADHVAMSPLLVMNVEIIEGKKVMTPDEGHPLNELFDAPNEFQSRFDFMYNFTVEDSLMGNGILWRPKLKEMMIIIPAETVALNFNNGRLKNYLVSSLGQGFQGSPIVEGMEFKLDEIWHKRRPNPGSLLWGLSPFTPNRKSILFNRYSQDYLNAFYLRGATPGMALKMEKNVSEDSALRFLRSFEAANTGRRNNRRTLILPKGVDAQILTPTLGDQNLVEVINNNREKILNILRIPKHMLSLAKTGSLGSEESKQAIRLFYTSAVIPTQKKIAAFFTRKFKDEGLLEQGKILAFDNSEVTALQTSLIEKAELGIKLRGQWTPNEIRAKLWNMTPKPGGDKLVGVLPNDLGNNPLPRDEQEEIQEEIEEEEENEEGKDLEILDEQQKAERDKLSAYHGKVTKAMEDEIESKQEVIVDAWLGIFEKWAEGAIKIAKRRLNARPKVKADDDIPQDLGNRAEFERELKAEFDRFSEEWETIAKEELIAPLALGYDLVADPQIWNEDALEAIEAFKIRNERERRLLLEARGIEAFKSARQHRAEDIMDVIQRGIEDKKGIKDIARDIRKNFIDIGESASQRIARTEVLTALSIGQAAGLEDSWEVDADVRKQWITSGDSRVRGTPKGKHASKGNHFRLDGDKIQHKIDGVVQVFDNDFRFPRDLKQSTQKPHEFINCRCQMKVIPSEAHRRVS